MGGVNCNHLMNVSLPEGIAAEKCGLKDQRAGNDTSHAMSNNVRLDASHGDICRIFAGFEVRDPPFNLRQNVWGIVCKTQRIGFYSVPLRGREERVGGHNRSSDRVVVVNSADAEPRIYGARAGDQGAKSVPFGPGTPDPVNEDNRRSQDENWNIGGQPGGLTLGRNRNRATASLVVRCRYSIARVSLVSSSGDWTREIDWRPINGKRHGVRIVRVVARSYGGNGELSL